MIKKIVAVTILVLMSIAVTVAPIGSVFGQNENLGVTIYQVTPQGAAPVAGQTTSSASVGDALNLQGTIYTNDGSWQVIFASQVVASGISQGYYVNANFSVPQLPTGTYALRLRDYSANINSSEDDLQVLTNETITAASSQIQEGSSIVLNVAVTGGSVGVSYIANVSVVLPSPLSTEYLQIVSLGTAGQTGTAAAEVTYPGSSFSPSG